jgi:hypothetical protein
VNPWSKAEPGTESAGSDGQGSESFERELFARRARAIGPAAIPSLASVMRAAEATQEEHPAQGARGRAIVALALAAACLMAASTRVPHVETNGMIVPDMDAAAPALASASRPVLSLYAAEATPAGECTLGEEIASAEERACFAPVTPPAAGPLFTPAPLFSLAPAEHSCAAEESCALPPP